MIHSHRDSQRMIKEYAADLAAEMGIELSGATLVEKGPSGSHDAYVVELVSSGKLASERIHQTELDNLQKGIYGELLEIKMRSALARLKMMLEP